MSNLAIIPARGGSKRIPRKNIKLFCGKPIIAYSIQAAIDSGAFDEIIVSTDDQEIAEIALRYGAQVPFMRSAELSTDTAGTAPVLLEVIRECEKVGRFFQYLCCVYPAAPFVTAQLLKNAMVLLATEQVDCVVPIVKYSHPPQRALVVRNNRAQMIYPENYAVRTQDFESIYHDCSQFYGLRVSSLKEQKKLFCAEMLPIEMPANQVQEIDTIEDWMIAELKYSVRGIP